MDVDGSMVAAHDPENCGQAQAATGELRREERIEDTLQRGGVHSLAGVRDLDVDELAWRDVVGAEAILQVALVAASHPGAYRNDAV